MLIFTFAVLLALISFISAQQVSLQLPIGGKAYPIQYRAHEVSAADAARQFCVSEASALGITNDTLPNCVVSVSEFLKAQTKGAMEAYAAKNTILVPVKIGDLSFDVTFRIDTQSAADMATQLCSVHAQKLGVTKETLPNCVGPVSGYLQKAVTQFVAQRSVGIRITLENIDFDINMRRDLISAVEMGEKLCRENAKVLNVNNDNFRRCIEVAGGLIQTRLNEVDKAQMIRVPMKIGNLDTTLEVLPSLEEVKKLAKAVCSSQYRAQTGIQEEQTGACEEGVVGYVRTWFTRQVQAAQAAQQQQQQQQQP